MAMEYVIGSSFEFEGVTYEIEPKVYAARVVRVLKRAMVAKRLRQIEEMVAILQSRDSARLRPALAMLYDIAAKPYSPNTLDIARAVQDDEDVIAAVLLHCSPQVKNEEHARRIVDEYPDFVELGLLATEATGISQAGNSLRARAIRDRIVQAQPRTEDESAILSEPQKDEQREATIERTLSAEPAAL